jgi:hypothetical protein
VRRPPSGPHWCILASTTGDTCYAITADDGYKHAANIATGDTNHFMGYKTGYHSSIPITTNYSTFQIDCPAGATGCLNTTTTGFISNATTNNLNTGDSGGPTFWLNKVWGIDSGVNQASYDGTNYDEDYFTYAQSAVDMLNISVCTSVSCP